MSAVAARTGTTVRQALVNDAVTQRHPAGHAEAEPCSTDLAEAVIGDVIAEMLSPAAGRPAVTESPVEHAAAVTELVAAATRHVFAPDPLADPAGVLTEPAVDAWSGDADATTEADSVALAARAAVRASVIVRPIDTHVDVAAAVSVLDAVFAPDSGHHFYPPSLLRNLLAAGAPMLLAWDGDLPVGVLLALPGWSVSGRPLVQSGPMAVVPNARGRGVSVALKLAQRAWALSRSVTEIRWTFDAMAATNARLNLSNLGAHVEAFLPGYEGVRDADSATPLPHDRLLVAWYLEDAAPVPPRSRPVPPVWVVTAGADGLPVRDPEWARHPVVLVAVPADIGSLRRADPQSASAWQQTTGGVLREALALGWEIAWDTAGGYRLTAPGR